MVMYCTDNYPDWTVWKPVRICDWSEAMLDGLLHELDPNFDLTAFQLQLELQSD